VAAAALAVLLCLVSALLLEHQLELDATGGVNGDRIQEALRCVWKRQAGV
jgi:hypothetical protein